MREECQTKQICYSQTPVGWIGLVEEGGFLRELFLGERSLPPESRVGESPLLKKISSLLDAYFKGERVDWSGVPLLPKGTAFQLKVWKELQKIPYGQTRTYGQIAAQLGNPRACRAVGMANHRNPIPIIIPCHRVVGAHGALVGYAAGVEIKMKLLELEGQK